MSDRREVRIYTDLASPSFRYPWHGQTIMLKDIPRTGDLLRLHQEDLYVVKAVEWCEWNEPCLYLWEYSA